MTPPVRIADGLRFGCTRCGNCCRQPGYVWISVDEMANMARYLSLPLDEFQESFDVQWDSNAQSWRIDAVHGEGCPLLDGDDCRVHPVKPSQCKTFPFWPELLDDRNAWNEAKNYCPGMDSNSGRLYSPREIRKQRRSVDAP